MRNFFGAVRTAIQASVKYVAFTSLAVAAAVVVHYHATRGSVQIEYVGGEMHYVHSDAETTRILNYISGKDAMTQEERLALLREGLEYFCSDNPKQCEGLHELNGTEIVLRVVQNLRDDISSDEGTLSDLDALIPLQREWDPQLYHNLWQLEVEVGAPYLRWTVVREDQAVTPFGHKRAHYDPFTNSVHVLPYDPLESTVSEFAHAVQFTRNPFDFWFEGIKMGVRVGERVLDGEDFESSYDEEYLHEGSLEHEAHEIIEPALEARLGIQE